MRLQLCPPRPILQGDPGALDEEAESPGADWPVPSPSPVWRLGVKAKGHCLPGAAHGTGWHLGPQMLPLPPRDQGQPWVPRQDMAEHAGEVCSSPLHSSPASAHLPFKTHPGLFPTVKQGREGSDSQREDPPTRKTVLVNPHWSPLLEAP